MNIKMNIVASSESVLFCFNPVALRKAKIAHNFGLSECNRVKSFSKMSQ